MMNFSSKMIPPTLLASALLATVNVSSAAIVSVEYGGTIDTVSGTGSPVTAVSTVSGRFTINTDNIPYITGDSSNMYYSFYGSDTYGEMNVGNGWTGSNSVYFEVEDNYVTTTADFGGASFTTSSGTVVNAGDMVDGFFAGTFSNDYVWDNAQNRSVGGMEMFLDLTFLGNAFGSTDLNLDILTSGTPVHRSVWLAGFDASGEIFNAEGSLDILNVTVSSVPVPAAVWLFGSGLAGLIGIARRKTR